MSDAAAAQRDAVVAWCAEQIAAGMDIREVRRGAMALAPDADRATVYRWVTRATRDGHMSKEMEEAHTALDTAAAGVTGLPAGQIVSESVATLRHLMRYAMGKDVTAPRNPKMAMAAAQALVSSLKTAVELHRMLADAQKVEAFHAALVDEVGKESPQAAQRIHARLQALTNMGAG